MDERRVSQRIPMELPIEIRWKTRAGSLKQAMGKTGNISGNGLFVEFPVHLQRKTAVTVKVVLPREGGHVPLELSCQGRVVRWKQDGRIEGLCVIIDEYKLRPLFPIGSGDKRQRKRAVRNRSLEQSPTRHSM